MVSLSQPVIAVLVVLGGGLALLLAALYDRRREARIEAFEEYADEVEAGEPVAFEPPDVTFNPLDYLRVARHLQRGKRLGKKGYVKWYRLDSTLRRPTWVKPETDGSGVPKVTVDGQPYYFPKDAMVADSLTGAWVAVHRVGDGDPINLREPAYPALETDLVERTINLEAENEPPGFLDGLFGGMDQTTLMYLVIGIMFVIYAAYRYAGGM